MPTDPNQGDTPDKVKRFMKWLEDDAAKDAWRAIKDATQVNPIEYAFDVAKDTLAGEAPVNKVVESLVDVDTDQISVELANKIRTIMRSRGAIEFSETMGAIITEPILSILESYAAKDDFDPMEFARAFHGSMILLNMPKAIAEITDIEVAGTKLGSLGKSIESIYWSLGMGFLGWQTMAPLLSAGLQPRLERHYNALYRPKRLNMSDMIYLYLIGDLTLSALNKYIAEEGYPNAVSAQVIRNSFRTLNRGELEEFYQKGQITKDDIYKQLIKQGYEPKYASIVRDNITLTPEDTQKSASVSKFREAVKKGIRTTNEYRDFLEDLQYSKTAINLEIELLNYDRLSDKRELTIGQLKAAYVVGQIGKTEVLSELRELGYTAEDTNTLTLTWDAEKRPKVLKLNQTNVVAAFKAGVLSASQTLARLQQIGYPASEANIILETAKAGLKKTGLRISLPMFLDAFKVNAISENEFITRMKAEGIEQSDITILLKLAKFEPVQRMVSLDVERAFKAGVIDEGKAKTLLERTRVEQSAIQLKIDTWKAESKGFELAFSPATYLLWYRQDILSKDELSKRLKELGFTNRDVELFVKSADLALPDDLTRTEIHDLYVADVIEKSRAITLLKKTGIETKEINDLIEFWDKEIENDTPEPSASEYIAALRNELLTEAEFTKKLQELGYDSDTIKFYIKLAGTEEKEKTQKLSKTDILNMYIKELLKKSQALERLVDLGYSQSDAELLIKLKEPQQEED